MEGRSGGIAALASAITVVLALGAGGAWVRTSAGSAAGGADAAAAMLIVPDGFPGEGPPDLGPLAAAPGDVAPGASVRGVHGHTACDGACPPSGHWGPYGFGPDELVATRAFWVIDRTGHAAAQRALADVVRRWNREVEATERPGEDLPYIAYYRDDLHPGNCSPDPESAAAYWLPGYSVLLACEGRLLDAMGRAYTIPGGDHWGSGWVPWLYVDADDTFCNGGPMTHGQLVSAYAHEVGHILGLDHRSGVTLMNRNAGGVCAGGWFDAHDRATLGAIYSHPAHS